MLLLFAVIPATVRAQFQQNSYFVKIFLTAKIPSVIEDCHQISCNLPLLHHLWFQMNAGPLRQSVTTWAAMRDVALRPCIKLVVLINWDERGSKAEEDFSLSRKCHFSVIVYDSSLHLWLNNEGWQLERAMGVGIKGLRFPLAEPGLSECARSKLDPDVGPCAAIQAAAAAAAIQQALSASQPAGHSASQSLNLRARKHDRRLSWWELWTEAPLQIKEFQLATLPEPKYHFFACCDLSSPRFVSLSTLCLRSSFGFWLFPSFGLVGMLVEAK